jgi:hypothetical protein
MAEFKIDEELRKARQEAAAKIDPDTVEITWDWGQIMDPYDENPDLPDEMYQIGRRYFVRSPGSDTWVSFYDLPKETVNVLWDKLKRGELREAFAPSLED